MLEQARTLIQNATVLSMDPEVGDLAGGDVLVEGPLIRAVGRDLDVNGSVDVVDATGCIVVPGLVDTHRHMWEAIVRGIAPQHTFGQYMSHILGDIGPVMTPHDLYLGDLLSARAALAAGVTTVQDISNIQDTPEHTDAIVGALLESGLRAVFAYGKSFPAMMSGGGRLPDDVRRVRSELLPDRDALVTMALDAEGGDDDSERHNAALARELDVPISRHFSSRLSVAHLRDLGTLLPGTTFIHGNGLAPTELELIADSGGSLSISPAIEMIMGHGFPMLSDALTHPALPISLSVDVEVTVPSDMFTQMRAAYQAGRHGEHAESDVRDPKLTVADVLHLATLSGAQTLGLADRIGSVTPGKQADLVVLRADRPDVAPVYDPYSAVVLQMDRSHVDTVMVAGRITSRGGHPVDDSSTLLREAAAVSRRLVDAVVREFFPKGTDITSDPNYLAMVACDINDRPRKIHNWKKPSELFTELVEANASTA